MKNSKIQLKETEDLPPIVYVDPPGEISPCGPVNDLQHVEQYNGNLGVTSAFVSAHQAPVGQVQWNNNLASIYTNPGNVSGVRWCSGTLISDDLFLTAGHCFDQSPGGWIVPRINGTNDPIPSTEIATNMHVNFDYQLDSIGNPKPEQSFNVIGLVEYREGGLDYAILRLQGNPGQIFGVAQVANVDAAVGDMLCIIQHPNGDRKMIEAGPATAISSYRIEYNDIDTDGGTSGSGILLSPNGTLVGVHTNGGCKTDSTGYNFGVRISYLIEKSLILQKIVGLKISGDPSIYTKQDGEIGVAVPLSTGGIAYAFGRPNEFPGHYWDRPDIIGSSLGTFEDVKLYSYNQNYNQSNLEQPGVIARNGNNLIHFIRGRNKYDQDEWSPEKIIVTNVSGNPSIMAKEDGEIGVAVPLSTGGIAYAFGRPNEFPGHYWDRPDIIGSNLGTFEDVKLYSYNQNYNQSNLEQPGVIARNGNNLIHFRRGRNKYDQDEWSLIIIRS
ncbi:trypsin-like peptidase domain-containing protein [Bacillus sp. F19]|nr:trypsin-like peptidase domain-containing protein [Bacillus sp. F19]